MKQSKPLNRLLTNKRGQIPTTDIVGTVVDGIRSFITWFLNTAPKPLLFLLFLVFLLFLGNLLIPLLLNSMGYHCDTQGTVWKVGGLQLFTNFDLVRHKPEYVISDGVQYQELPWLCGSGREDQHIALCTNCTHNETFLGVSTTCASDGYRLDHYPLLTRLTCNWIGCAPPEYYFYNYTVDKFECMDSSCINATLDDYNRRIYEIEGATPAYPFVNGSYDYMNLMYVACAEDNPVNVRLTLYGIDIFSYKLWVALTILGILIYFYSQFRK